MRRCVIIGGADIGRYDRIRAYLRADDFYICCDSGLKHREGLGIAPDLIVGDFDSYENQIWKRKPLCFHARRMIPTRPLR